MTYAERMRAQASQSKCLTCKHCKTGVNGAKTCSNLGSSTYGKQLNPGEKCSLYTSGLYR